MTTLSHSPERGRRLRNAYYCPDCSGTLCSADCLSRHGEKHRPAPGKPPEHPEETPRHAPEARHAIMTPGSRRPDERRRTALPARRA
jgi:hypothetical protein